MDKWQEIQEQLTRIEVKLDAYAMDINTNKTDLVWVKRIMSGGFTLLLAAVGWLSATRG